MLLFALMIPTLFPSLLPAQQTRQLMPFDEVKAVGKVIITLQPGERPELVVEGTTEEIESLDLTQSGPRVSIQVINHFGRESSPLRVTLYYQDLREITVLAGAELSGREVIRADKMDIKSGSGARVELVIETEALEATASEGGEMHLSGRAGLLEGTASTGGILDGFDLQTERAYARAGTGGQLTVSVSDLLDARANLGGVIEYHGQPSSLYTRTFLAGEINHFGRGHE